MGRKKCMILNDSKTQHLHFRSKLSSTLQSPNQDGTYVPLFQVRATKDHGVIVQHMLNSRAQVEEAVVKASRMFAVMRRTHEQRTLNIILPVYSALVRSPNSARDFDAIITVQRVTTKSIPDFKRLAHTEHCRRLKLCSFWRRRLR